MKLVGYVRVSTVGQATEGLGLGDQRDAIRAWARANGHRLVTVLEDAAISGTKDLDGRAGLAEALGMVKDGRAAGIVVYKLDRLARDMILQEQLLAEVWRLGGEVLSTAGGESNLRDDPEDPSRRMIRQILGAVAEYERNMIVLRLRRGRASKARKGGYAYGGPRFGRQAVDKALVPHQPEQAVVRRIRKMHEGGASIRRICEILNAEGVASKRGGRWHPTTVARVLDRV